MPRSSPPGAKRAGTIALAGIALVGGVAGTTALVAPDAVRDAWYEMTTDTDQTTVGSDGVVRLPEPNTYDSSEPNDFTGTSAEQMVDSPVQAEASPQGAPSAAPDADPDEGASASSGAAAPAAPAPQVTSAPDAQGSVSMQSSPRPTPPVGEVFQNHPDVRARTTGSNGQLPSAVAGAWGCAEGQTVSGQSTLGEAEQITGQAVFIPALCVAVPVVDAGNHTFTRDDGTTDTAIDLWNAPTSSRYDQSMPFGSKAGSTMVASHVNYSDGGKAPFYQLFSAKKGTPIIARDEAGDYYVYELARVSQPRNNDQTGDPGVTATPDLDWLFTRTGDPALNLVTCAGNGFVSEDGEAYLEYNLISSADLVGKIEG